LLRERSFDPDTRRAGEHENGRTFIELRNEFGAKAGELPDGKGKESAGHENDSPAVRERKVEDRFVRALRCAYEPIVTFPLPDISKRMSRGRAQR
jgi:hypothetical protein